MQDDPIFARVAAARPAPPLALTAAIEARLPVRAQRSRFALILASTTAVAVIAVLAIARVPRHHDRALESHVGSAGVGSADAGVTPRDAVVDAPQRIDPDVRAKQLVAMLESGDVDAAMQIVGVPLAHLTCSPGIATDASAARDAVRCIAKGVSAVRLHAGKVEREDLAQVIGEVRSQLDPQRKGRRRQTPAEADTQRSLIEAATALDRDHVFVGVVLTSWPANKPYPGSGQEMTLIFAIDPSGRVDAIIPTDEKILD